MTVKQAEEVQSGGGLHLPVELLHDDLFHPDHVGHREAVLTDADQVVGQRHVLLLLRGFHSDVEAAQADAGQVLGLNLSGTKRVESQVQIIQKQIMLLGTYMMRFTNLHHREEPIKQADGKREGLRAETKEPGEGEQVLHLQFSQAGGHPEAVVLGTVYKSQSTELWLVSAFQIHQGLQLDWKGLRYRCYCFKHLGRWGRKN